MDPAPALRPALGRARAVLLLGNLLLAAALTVAMAAGWAFLQDRPPTPEGP